MTEAVSLVLVESKESWDLIVVEQWVVRVVQVAKPVFEISLVQTIATG